MSFYKRAMTVDNMINFLNQIENKELNIMVTSLGEFGKAKPVIGADVVLLSTDGTPGLYLCVEE